MHSTQVIAFDDHPAPAPADGVEEQGAGNEEPIAPEEPPSLPGICLAGPARVARYLSPGEHVLYTTRRHVVVLRSAVATWLAALGLGAVAVAAAGTYPGAYLVQAGIAVCGAGTAVLGWRAWQWWVASYVLTSDRVLFLEGVASRRVHGIPLRSVLDTTYRRTPTGRLLGYGHLELNLSGRPGLRTLSSLPRPDHLYRVILILTSVRDVMDPLLQEGGRVCEPCSLGGGARAPLPGLSWSPPAL